MYDIVGIITTIYTSANISSSQPPFLSVFFAHRHDGVIWSCSLAVISLTYAMYFWNRWKSSYKCTSLYQRSLTILFRANSIEKTCYVLDKFVSIIGLTVITVANLVDEALQRDVYNVHNRKHYLKFHAVTTPDRLIIHVSGPVVVLHHDWWMNIQILLDQMLPKIIQYDGKNYLFYSDYEYNRR